MTFKKKFPEPLQFTFNNIMTKLVIGIQKIGSHILFKGEGERDNSEKW